MILSMVSPPTDDNLGSYPSPNGINFRSWRQFWTESQGIVALITSRISNELWFIRASVKISAVIPWIFDIHLKGL